MKPVMVKKATKNIKVKTTAKAKRTHQTGRVGLLSFQRFTKAQLIAFGALFAIIGFAFLLPSFAATPNATEKMGVFRGATSAPIPDYEKWLGRPISYALTFVGGGSTDTSPWDYIDNPGWYCSQWASTKYTPIMSTTILPTGNLSLEAGARGDYNAHWKNFAQVLVDRGCADSVVRLGWEFNGGWYNWAAQGKEASYAEYWRQIVTSMRSVPGQQFKFDWCPNASSSTAVNIPLAYPGDNYVDIIGLDAYDQSYVHTSYADRWNDQLNYAYGIQWQKKFATEHGKQISFPEWGVVHRYDYVELSGEDNPYYIQKMYDWMNALPASGPGSLAYHAYFEVDASDGAHRLMLGQFPNSAAMFKKLFGVLPSTTTTADTSAPSAPSGVTATVASQSQIDLSWQPSTDNVGVTAYEIYMNGAKVTTVTANTANVTGLTAATQYSFYVVARDAAGNVSQQSNAVSATTNSSTVSTAPVSIPFRMNTGYSSSYTDPAGLAWGPDRYYSTGGGTYASANAIANTDKDKIYQSERWGMSSYNIPVANGTYLLRLHFAEIHPESGQRIFNVSAEGQALLTNFDIAAAVGNYAAVTKDYIVTVNDGVLNTGFVTVANASKISAIELLPPPAPTDSTTTKTFSGTLSKYASATYGVSIGKAGTVSFAVSNTNARYDLTVFDPAGNVVAKKLNTKAPFTGIFNATTTGTYKFKLTTKFWSARSHTLKVTYQN
jgi:hypothetical protein